MSGEGAGAGSALALTTRTGLPDALRVLVTEIPRESWEQHRNFGALVQFWMQRHMAFREMLARLANDAERRIAGDLDPQDYAARLSATAGRLLKDLHGHHQIEDQHYFPRLVTLDARVAAGFDLLDGDHHALDGHLHDMAEAANAVLQGGAVGMFRARLEGFQRLLDRHLVDEEEIVVPVILRSGFAG